MTVLNFILQCIVLIVNYNVNLTQLYFRLISVDEYMIVFIVMFCVSCYKNVLLV